MRESGGRRDVLSADAAGGMVSVRSDADIDASAIIHSVKKAVGDFDV
jgi:hypothetical protein